MDKENSSTSGIKKGVLFDTNRTHYCMCTIVDMLNNNKVSAYWDKRYFASYLNKGDYVLYYLKGRGVIAAGTVTSEQPKDIDIEENKKEKIDEHHESYHEVNIEVPKIHNKKDFDENNLRCISAKELKELLGKNFFFARTIKVPYLTMKETEIIIKELKKKYNEKEQ